MRRLRATLFVGAAWAATWATVGSVVNTWRFFLDADHLRLEKSLRNLWVWVRIGIEVGGSCGFVAGCAFAVLLAFLHRRGTARTSLSWSLGYGLTSGALASFYILQIGYGPVMLPFFAGLFAISGALAAIGTAALANHEPTIKLSEHLAA